MSIAIAILAGGHSRRMGQPKALLPVAGKPLIEHLIEHFKPEAHTVLVAGCPEPGLYSHLSVPVLADALGTDVSGADISRGMGPLGGIYTALRYVNVNLDGVKAVLCVPCDGLQLPFNFVQRMSAALAGHEAVFARDAQRDQPLYCLIRSDLQQDLMKYLNSGGRKVIDWLETHHYAVVDFSGGGFCFANFNTPEEWRQFISND